jgi:hypothetical protein
MKHNYFLKTILLLCISFFSNFTNGQTAGDIAFIAYNGDLNDEFAIVALSDIPANTSIWFTDNEWDGTDRFNNINEGEVEWSHTSILKAGSIIVIAGNSGSSATITSGVGTVNGSGINLGVSNETLYALLDQPVANAAMLTPGFLAGISNDLSGDGVGLLTNTGLTSGTDFIDFANDHDGFKFTGSRSTQTSYASYLPQIMNTVNWQDETSLGGNILPISQESFTINTTDWTGTLSADWDTAGNWNNGIPTSSSLVTIPEVTTAPDIETNTNAVVGNISITEVDGLEIFGGTLTVTGNITINTGGSLYLESEFTASKTIDAASVILNGTYTSSDANKFFYFTETFNDDTSGWSLVSSPTVGEVIDGGATGFATFNALQTSGTNYGIAPYDNSVVSASRWDYYTTTEIAATNTLTMTSAKGYSVLPNSALNGDTTKGTLGFKGSISTSDIDIAITDNSVGSGTGVGNAFNLIGNPYPSFAPFNTTANAVNLLTSNTGVLDEETIWFWDKTTSTYITVNQTTTVGSGANQRASLYIAPAQGFFVKSKTAGGNFTFTEEMQSHQTSSVFNRRTNTRPEINLSITDNTITKNTLIYYYDDKTTDFDNGYDSSMFGGVSNSFAVYSQLVSNNEGKNLAIQALPNSNFENMVIPIGINSGDKKTITFKASSLNLPDGIKVVLEDKETNIFTDLSEAGSEYTFTTTSLLNGIGRFYLHTSSSILSIDSNSLNSIHVFNTNKNTIQIRGLSQSETTIQLFNILGKQVVHYSFKTTNGIKEVTLPKLSSGIYILQLENENGKLSKKIIIE